MARHGGPDDLGDGVVIVVPRSDVGRRGAVDAGEGPPDREQAQPLCGGDLLVVEGVDDDQSLPLEAQIGVTQILGPG